MTLTERFSELVRACFSGLWIRSFGHDDAVIGITRPCRRRRRALATWDTDRGLAIAGWIDGPGTALSASDLPAAIKAIGSLARANGMALLVLRTSTAPYEAWRSCRPWTPPSRLASRSGSASSS
jgi:hypothetical protein